MAENFDQVVSDKQLVKHLQKEVSRLEAELRTPDPSNEKDFKIRQVDMSFQYLFILILFLISKFFRFNIHISKLSLSF